MDAEQLHEVASKLVIYDGSRTPYRMVGVKSYITLHNSEHGYVTLDDEQFGRLRDAQQYLRPVAESDD